MSRLAPRDTFFVFLIRILGFLLSILLLFPPFLMDFLSSNF